MFLTTESIDVTLFLFPVKIEHYESEGFHASIHIDSLADEVDNR